MMVSVWVLYSCNYVCRFFFFKQKTAYEMRISDWSSDVCSSDLHGEHLHDRPRPHLTQDAGRADHDDQQGGSEVNVFGVTQVLHEAKRGKQQQYPQADRPRRETSHRRAAGVHRQRHQGAAFSAARSLITWAEFFSGSTST